jgi:hypothetical protein
MKKSAQPKIRLANFSLLSVCLVSTVFSLGTFVNLLLSVELIPSAYAEQKTTSTTTIRYRQAPTASKNAEIMREFIQSRSANNGTEHADSEQQDSGSPSAVRNAAGLIKQQRATGD